MGRFPLWLFFDKHWLLSTKYSEAVFNLHCFLVHNGLNLFRDYIDLLCKSLNERITDVGILSISQLTKAWDLPTELVNSLVLVEVGSKVDAIRDGDTLYTGSYLSAERNNIRAMLCGLTKFVVFYFEVFIHLVILFLSFFFRVTSITKLQSKLQLTSTMFWSLFDELDAMEEVLLRNQFLE